MCSIIAAGINPAAGPTVGRAPPRAMHHPAPSCREESNVEEVATASLASAEPVCVLSPTMNWHLALRFGKSFRRKSSSIILR
jgi:hypothetical protein